MKVRELQRLLVLTILVAGMLTACTREHLDKTPFVGMTKLEVRKTLGEPTKIEQMIKTRGYIFGPVENLWNQIKEGDKIEIWIYEIPLGKKDLYFLETSDKVIGEFFWYRDEKKNPNF